MPRTARPNQRPAARREPPRLDPAVLVDAAEGVGEEFAEATEHAVRRAAFRGLTLGPVADIPSVELLAGALGWRRALYGGARASARSGPEGGDARIGCVVVPSVGTASALDSPYRDPSPGERVVAMQVPMWPHRVITIRPGGGVTAATVRRFAAAVLEELAED
jgi:hypothetical protein